MISSPPKRQYYRNYSEAFSIFTAAFSHPKSSYYESQTVLTALNGIIDKLIALQYPDGTLDSGGNRQSPPDTAFLLDSLCPAAIILKEKEAKEVLSLRTKLDEFLLAAGEGN